MAPTADTCAWATSCIELSVRACSTLALLCQKKEQMLSL